MYNIPHFKEKDRQAVVEFIHQNPFAFICGVDHEQKPVATQIPVFIEEKEGKLFLTGHIMKQTDHHKAFENNSNVLVVFTGPHTYVSATWYSDPHQASTWNYMSVHAKGTIKFLDEKGLEDILRKTTLHFENGNKESTTIFNNLSPDYTQKLMKAIAGFEIEIIDFDNVFKLSQNRDQKSYENIKQQLQSQGKDGESIAAEMEKRKDQLFPGGG